MFDIQSPIHLIRLLSFTSFSFVIGILLTPLFTDFLYRNKLGKKIRHTDYAGEKAPIYKKLHQGKEGTPTMAGLLIWVPTTIITFIFNMSRSGTWLPLFCLVGTGIIGALDDVMNIRGIGPNRGGMRFCYKLLFYSVVAAVGAWWFFFKLGWSTIHIPFAGNFEIGLWYIPIFIIGLVFFAFAVNETDGLDGLAGGTLALSYGAYAIIALSQGKLELAIFCATILGLLLSFLWFNIHPARFFMGDTGAMSLGMTLGVIAFLTNTPIVLFVIGFVFVVEALSVMVQITSKKIFKKKIFLSSPLHHHLEALGWPETKVTMRFWIISAVSASVGLAIALFDKI
ncbi:MAG TPA: phospho-N-acetylmuramoyl-pentapeptide-transferase [bacterium]|jgi:phospho-N-acetylmuramoyl-pentapeptide-transferase|nr:phospho-N-acetylmuramoyl-pentapeptide-transferase [bacterium]